MLHILHFNNESLKYSKQLSPGSHYLKLLNRRWLVKFTCIFLQLKTYAIDFRIRKLLTVIWPASESSNPLYLWEITRKA